MRNIFLGFILLSLGACEGSTAKGFWGPSAPAAAIWGQEQTPLCKFYGNCDSDSSDNGAAPNETGNAAAGGTIGNTNDNSSWWWGNAGESNSNSGGPDSGGTKSCELYGNCE